MSSHKIESQISLHDFRDVPICLLGLGKSGLSCALALIRGGARLSAWDDDPAARAQAQKMAIPLSDLRQEESSRESLRECSFLLLAPGISQQHPIVDSARFWGKEVIGDVELLWRAYPEARWLAITGTNGKSTTTALLAHIYATLGREAKVGGNLGPPVFDFTNLQKSGADAGRGAGAEIVLELSSFQLDLIDKARFNVAVLLNIAPDHLDRHRSMEAYLSAKMRIARNSKDGDILICGIDDELSQRLFLSFSKIGKKNGNKNGKKTGLRVYPISAQHEAPGGVWVADGRLYDDMDYGDKDGDKDGGLGNDKGNNLGNDLGRANGNANGNERVVYKIPECSRLRGLHNAQNIAAAYALARSDGLLEPQKIIDSLSSFKGLAHRMDDLGVSDGLRFVNDSKATNPHSSAHALVAYADSAVYWLAGGRAKGDSASTGGAGEWLQEIYELLLANPFVRAGFFFGEARNALQSSFADIFPCSAFPSLAEAFAAAVSAAKDNDKNDNDKNDSNDKKDNDKKDSNDKNDNNKKDSKVLLFSPACASFDQFKDYVQRGECFSRLVAELKARPRT